MVDDRINRIQDLSSDKIVIQESGYLEVYVNNAAQTPVYYDNLVVMQSLVIGGTVEVAAGAMLMSNTSENASKGYNHGEKNTSNSNASNPNTSEKKFKKAKSNISGKEGAKDVPHFAKGYKPYVGESADNFAKRILDTQYGEGNYPTTSNTEYSQIKKWGNRNFE